MARLILESGGERREYAVSAPVTLGRAKTNPIVLEDRVLSREHTRINVDRGPDGTVRYSVRDLESKNGTFLNGELIRRTEPLNDGDKLRIGKFHFRFALDSHEGPHPAPRRPKTAHKGAAEHPKTPTPAPARYHSPHRKHEEPGPSAAGRLFFAVFLLAILVAGTYGAKILFVWALHRAFPE